MAEDNENNTKQQINDDYLKYFIDSISNQNHFYNDYPNSAVNQRKQSYIDEIKATYPEIKNTDIESLKTLLLTETNNKLDNKMTDKEIVEINKKIKLLEDYINLDKLVQIATTYVGLFDYQFRPMDEDWTRIYLDTYKYKYEDIIKIYEHKIKEEIKNQRTTRLKNAQQKKKKKQKKDENNDFTINPMHKLEGGRRSTRKRKKTIRKKRKNKKRTRRFR